MNSFTREYLSTLDPIAFIKAIQDYPLSAQWKSIEAYKYTALRLAMNYGLKIKST